jgi:dTDP-4-dehydrorhamnose reductase
MRILLAGATGATGSTFLSQKTEGQAITLLLRKPLAQASDLSSLVIDFSKLEQTDLPACDAVVCALGTTMKKAGSKEAFEEVDFHYVLALAKASLKAGATHFIVISAKGADPKSAFFYNRVKGNMEEALKALGFPHLSILRPSLIMAKRQEQRLGESIAQVLFGALNAVLPASIKGLPVEKLAASIHAVLKNPSGLRIIESDALQTPSQL